MKKTKLLLLLSLPMILASCGKEKNSTPVSSAPSEDSSITSGEISSSVAPENEMTEEEKVALFVKGFKDVQKVSEDAMKSEKSMTIVVEQSEHSIYNEAIYNDPKSTTPYQEQYQESYDTDWDTYAYDSVRKEGYMLEEELDNGTRSFDEIEWVAKESGKYKLYDSYYETISDVDDGYAWNEMILRSPGFDMFANEDPEEMLLNMNYGVRTIKRTFDNIKASFAEDNVGTLEINNGFSVDFKKEGNKGEFTFAITVSTNYTKPTISSPNDLYLDGFDATLVEEAVIKYDEYGIYDLSVKEFMHMKMEGLMKETRIVNEQIFEYGNTLNRKLEYTPYTQLIDTSTYTDGGEIFGSLTFYDEWGAYAGGSNVYNTLENQYLITPETCLESDAVAAGITVEYYSDKEFKNKVDPTKIEKKSYGRDFYIKRIVPSDVVYVDLRLNGIMLDDILEGDYTPATTSWDSYIGAPKNNFVPAAYEKHNFYSETSDEYITSATFAPVSVKIIGTTDANPSIKADKFIDLKGGNYYYLEYDCEQVA